MRLERQPVPQARRRPRIPSSHMNFSKSDARHHPVRSVSRGPGAVERGGGVYARVRTVSTRLIEKLFHSADGRKPAVHGHFPLQSLVGSGLNRPIDGERRAAVQAAPR